MAIIMLYYCNFACTAVDSTVVNNWALEVKHRVTKYKALLDINTDNTQNSAECLYRIE